jgi:oligopeptide transport system ATP-binding protein
MSTLLEVAGLNVSFATRDGEVQAVRDLSFSLRAGEVLGIVGESGSGKTQAALALTGLLAENSRMSGSVLFEGPATCRCAGSRCSPTPAVRASR